MSPQDWVQRKIQEIRREYASRGYDVLVEPRADQLPPPLKNLRPDLLAVGEKETVVIEVRTRLGLTSDLEALAKGVESQPGFRFELVFTNPKDDHSIPPATLLLDEERIAERIGTAEDLLINEYFEASLLVLWSALEAALRYSAVVSAIELKRTNIAGTMNSLYSLGLLSDRQFDLLERSLRDRNAISHGLQPPARVDAETLQRLISLARRLITPSAPTVGIMVDWFTENYEDPANGVFYDTREGGYQYFLGGPYFASEVLAAEFPGAFEEDLDEATSIIERESSEWVRRGQY